MSNKSINIEAIKRGIKEFNNDMNNLCVDYITSKVFNDKDSSMFAKVITIDKFWGTRLRKNEIPYIAKKLQEQDFSQNVSLGQRLQFFENLLESISNNEKVRQNYSFLTKFLYWQFKGTFPIMDSKSRIKINGMQHQFKINKSLPDNIDGKVEDYENWLSFYDEYTNKLTKNEQKELCEYDKTTQAETTEKNACSQLVIKNSILRVLDKYFYISDKM